MITLNLTGGLGNQMFQYATGLALASKLDTKLLVNTSVFQDYNVHPLRLTELNCSAQFSNERPFAEALIRHKLIKKLLSSFSFMNSYYFEKGLAFDPSLLNAKSNTKLTGFFQSEKYFKSIRKILLREFDVRHKVSAAEQDILQKIENTESVSIHIRRGDYISNPNANKTHGLCDNTYYENALAHLESANILSDTTKLFIFSDDIEWCINNLKFDYPCEFVPGSIERPEIDMFLMSQCKHNIIANSTFSWWGGWLNDHEQKIVIAPKTWFQTSKLNAADIVPDSWTRI